MISQTSKYLLVMLAVGSILLFAFLVTKHLGSNEKIYSTTKSLGSADITVKDLTFIQTRMGEMEWKILAESAEFFDEDKMAMISDANVFLKLTQGLEVQFSGDRGVINTEQQDFQIHNQQDDINVKLNNGYTILTRKLEWNNKRREISSDKKVRMLGPQFTIEGTGLLVKTLTQEMKIIQNVHATLQK
jgi:LPS export ABC transporter protein LptC